MKQKSMAKEIKLLYHLCLLLLSITDASAFKMYLKSDSVVHNICLPRFLTYLITTARDVLNDLSTIHSSRPSSPQKNPAIAQATCTYLSV